MTTLNGVRITKAYKSVARYRFPIEDTTLKIAVDLHAWGIFPRGTKTYQLSFDKIGGFYWVHPLFVNIKSDVRVPIEKVATWIKTLPIVRERALTEPYKLPDELWSEAERLAGAVDAPLTIIPIGEPIKPPPTGEQMETAVDYDRKYTLGELKQMCYYKGLSTSGDKKTLARRLLNG